MTLLLLLAQLSDFATARLSSELNPIGVRLLADPATALSAKLCLVALILAVDLALREAGDGKYRRLGPVVVVAGILGGIVGTISNL